MRRFDITTAITELTLDELPQDKRQLVEAARRATYRSYAPYSHFCVGAALLLDNGEIVTGSNQENAAYPSGICAERTTAYYAHSQYPDSKFVTIAIAARGLDGEFLGHPISPCGACRQALLEYETLAGQPLEVMLVGGDNVYVIASLSELLPFAFTDLG